MRQRLAHWRAVTWLTASVLLLSGSPATPTEATAAAACDPSRPFPQGYSEHQIESEGRDRSFGLYLPRSYSGRVRMPLVLDLHASGIAPETELLVTGMDRAAEEHGFVVLLPAAATEFARGGYTWNIPPDSRGVDDVGFVDEVLEVVRGNLCIDDARIYATGFSGGARLASELACRRPERFAAIGVVGGLRHPMGGEGSCRGAASVPIMAFHSLDDPVNQYERDPDRSPPYWTYGIDEAVHRWSESMGCKAPAEEQISSAVQRISYADCKNGAELVLYQLRGSGHVWPGSSFAFPEYLGRPEPSLDATDLVVQFFQRFPFGEK